MHAISFGYTHIFVPEALAEYVDYTWRDSSEFGILDWKILVSLPPNNEQQIVFWKEKLDDKLTVWSTVVSTVSSQAKRSIVLVSRDDVTAAPTERTTRCGSW